MRRRVDGHLRPVAAELTAPHLLQHLDPVDVVYTWVDGSDPAWQERRDRALRELGGAPLHELAANDSRYTSHDELRYSLRSLEMYAPWVRQVFLVTDHQVPAWLRTDHPRLTVVDHTDLFGARGRLPTFNSHAIESQLHHLDGLAENYLYLNDDVFFGRPGRPGAVRPRQRPGPDLLLQRQGRGRGRPRRATCRSPARPRTTGTCCWRSSAGPRCTSSSTRRTRCAARSCSSSTTSSPT